MDFNITNLQSCLMSLGALKGFLEDSLRSFKAIQRADTRFVLGNYILINVHSFNQEWKRFESFAKEDDSVKRSCKIAKPATDRIRYWKGLSQLRSKVLAHEMYDKNDQNLVNFKRFFGDKKAPAEAWEQALLGECAVYAISVALSCHSTLHGEAQMIVEVSETHKLSVAGISTAKMFNIESDLILEQILIEAPELRIGLNTGRDIDLKSN